MHSPADLRVLSNSPEMLGVAALLTSMCSTWRVDVWTDVDALLATPPGDETVLIACSAAHVRDAAQILSHIQKRAPQCSLLLVHGVAHAHRVLELGQHASLLTLLWPGPCDHVQQLVDTAMTRNSDFRRIEGELREREAPFHSLSAREKEVLTALRRGADNQAIARAFSISKRTVDDHRGAILRKSNLGSITEVVRVLARADALRLELRTMGFGRWGAVDPMEPVESRANGSRRAQPMATNGELRSLGLEMQRTDSSDAVVYVVDADNRLVWMNRQWTRSTAEIEGHQAFDMVWGPGADLLSAMTEPVRTFYAAHMEECRRTGKAWYHEYESNTSRHHNIVLLAVTQGAAGTLMFSNTVVRRVTLDTVPDFEPEPDVDPADRFLRCGSCQRVRPDRGGWLLVPSWIENPPWHRETICPRCVDRYPM